MVNHRRIFLVIVNVVICGLMAGCSGSSSHNTNQGTGAVLQLTPSANQSVEVSPTGTLSVSVSASQSVNWSLTSAGVTPLNILLSQNGATATLSSTSGTSTTFNFSETSQACGPNAATPLPIEVVATTSDSPPITAQLVVNVIQSPPCLARVPIITDNIYSSIPTTYTGCPPAGTVIPDFAAGAPPYHMVTQVGVLTQFPISAGSANGTPYGIPPFQWTLTGSLPSGLQLIQGSTSTSVQISGTPVSSQCSTFQLQLTDAVGGVSCDPTVTTSCVATTFNLAVLPASINPKVEPYSYSYDGVPYPPVSLEVAAATAPYKWYQDPQQTGATLAAGLALTSDPASSNIAELSGTPNAGDSGQSNTVGSSSGNIGDYPSLIYVSDSQNPYPAVGVASLAMWDFVPNSACSPSSAPISLVPNSVNGGNTSQNNVLLNNYLQGTYAFMLRGFDGGQPALIAGSMTLDGNGNVTSGIVDLIKGASSSPGITVSGGTYTVGLRVANLGSNSAAPDDRGCVTLNTSAGAITFDFSLGGCSNGYTESSALRTSDNACGMSQSAQNQNIAAGVFTTGRVIVVDDGTGNTAQMSGILRAQTTSTFSSGLSGPYAFGLAGWDSTQGHYSIAGSIQASSSGLSSIAADIDDAGTLGSQLTGGSGTLSSADPNGRITGTFSVGSATFDVALYEISANEAFVITTDALGTSSPVLTGEALTTASSFSAASFSNSNILAMGGPAPSGPDVSIGLLTFDGVSAVSGTIYEDQAATVGTTSVSAVYAVDPTTGRAAFTTSGQGQTLGTHGFVAYLVPPSPSLSRVDCSVPANCMTGFIVGTDATAQAGIFEFQTPALNVPVFTNRYIAGDYVYGTMENLDAISASFEGDVYATPSSTNSTGGSLGGAGSESPFTQDTIYGCLQSMCPAFFPQDTFVGSYSLNSNGSGLGSFGGGTVVSITNGNVNISIDESPTNTHPAIVIAEQ